MFYHSALLFFKYNVETSTLLGYGTILFIYCIWSSSYHHLVVGNCGTTLDFQCMEVDMSLDDAIFWKMWRCLISTFMSKWALILHWSNTAAAGFFHSQTAVAKVMAKTPQSLDPLCHWTSLYRTLISYINCHIHLW